MKRNITDILTEWFYRLPNGYAIEPYVETELQILSNILVENNIDPKDIMQRLRADVSIKEAPADDQFIPGRDKLKTDTAPTVDVYFR